MNGQKAQVQVAGRGAWQIDDVDRYTAATIEHVVLVDVTGGLREFYICPGDYGEKGTLRVNGRTRALVTARAPRALAR